MPSGRPASASSAGSIPDDMARAILFLASDEASAATNQTFVFDGGWL